MAIINTTFRYLFLAEPHCACRAIEKALLQQPGSSSVNAWVHASRTELIKSGIDRNLFVFSIVRHPADWIVTRYHHLTGWHRQGFKAFVEYHLDNELWERSVFMHGLFADQTLRYEHLHTTLNQLLANLSAPPVQLERVGETPGKKPWRSYYTPELLARVVALPDFLTFGYPTA